MAHTIEELICELPEEMDSIPFLEAIVDQCWVKISNIRGEKFCVECGDLIASKERPDLPPAEDHSCGWQKM